jgi:hypothetical protein
MVGSAAVVTFMHAHKINIHDELGEVAQKIKYTNLYVYESFKMAMIKLVILRWTFIYNI